MPRSHPPTLITTTRALLRDASLFPPASRVLVAVSGGPDSMALLHVLSLLAGKAPRAASFTLAAHGVDHGLRASAAAELDGAASFADSLGVPFGRTTVHVPPGGNLQARARTARYAALREAAAAAGATRIATAHHADDRAETVLLRLLRGTSPRGLAVMPPRAGDLVRPFLRARRADILAHVERHRIPFATDPSNADPRFLRARVRLELLPLLERLSPNIVETLCGLADELLALELAPAAPLPRPTRQALAMLARTRSPRTRVLLPGGLVAAFDEAKLAMVVEDPEKRRARG